MVQTEARIRVLLLRLAATYRLGSLRFDATIEQLRPIVAEHLALEEGVAPALVRTLSEEDAAALVDAPRDEHDAIAASFRRLVERKQARVVEMRAA